ncbi:MAG TPA: hypothetical protein VFF48_11840, partial [Brevundimonas sp.]|nr:hypothetical protein [Brevundimonas sp.]
MTLMLLVQAAAALAGEPSLAPAIAASRANVAGPSRDLWPGWQEAPFGVLVVGPQTETLYCHVGAAEGFTAGPVDLQTGCPTHTRARFFPETLQAAFPAVDGRPTVVVGTPEKTRLSIGSWKAILLHEHFHQWQTSQPDYYAKVNALDLSGGDATGSWMLNYPFPY